MQDIQMPQKKNTLKTKLLPSLFMLLGGSVALIIGLIMHFAMTKLLLVVFLRYWDLRYWVPSSRA